MSQCLIHFCLLVQFCCWNSDPFHHTDAQSWLQTNCVEQELHFFNFRSTSFSPLQHEYFYCDSSQNQDKSHTSCTLQHAVVLSFTLRFCKQFLHLFIAFALLQLDFLWNTVLVCHWSTLFHSFILARMGFCPFNFFVRCNCVISEVKAFKNICVCTTISYKRTPWPLRSGAPELEEFDLSPPDWVSVQSVVANYCCHVLKYREIQYCAKVWSHHSFLYILFQNLL